MMHVCDSVCGDTGHPQRRSGQGIEIRTPPRPPGLHGQLENPDEVSCILLAETFTRSWGDLMTLEHETVCSSDTNALPVHGMSDMQKCGLECSCTAWGVQEGGMLRLAFTPTTAGRLRRPPRSPGLRTPERRGNASGLCTPPSSSPSFSRQRRPSMSLSFSPPRRPRPMQEGDLQSPPSSPGVLLGVSQLCAAAHMPPNPSNPWICSE